MISHPKTLGWSVDLLEQNLEQRFNSLRLTESRQPHSRDRSTRRRPSQQSKDLNARNEKPTSVLNGGAKQILIEGKSLLIRGDLSNSSQLSAEIFTFTFLTALNLSSTGLRHLPAYIGNLTNLQSLNLSNNKLAELPCQVHTKLLKLSLLKVANNPHLDMSLNVAYSYVTPKPHQPSIKVIDFTIPTFPSTASPPTLLEICLRFFLNQSSSTRVVPCNILPLALDTTIKSIFVHRICATCSKIHVNSFFSLGVLETVCFLRGIPLRYDFCDRGCAMEWITERDKERARFEARRKANEKRFEGFLGEI